MCPTGISLPSGCDNDGSISGWQPRLVRLPQSPVSVLLATNGRTLGAMFLVGAAVGLAALGVPHGPHFNGLADVVIAGAAGCVGLWAWRRVRLGPGATSALVGLGTVAVGAGVYSGRGDLISVSAAVIYVWLALVAGLFLSAKRTSAWPVSSTTTTVGAPPATERASSTTSWGGARPVPPAVLDPVPAVVTGRPPPRC